MLLRQSVNVVVLHHVGHFDVLSRGEIEVVAADGERVAIAAENEDV